MIKHKTAFHRTIKPMSLGFLLAAVGSTLLQLKASIDLYPSENVAEHRIVLGGIIPKTSSRKKGKPAPEVFDNSPVLEHEKKLFYTSALDDPEINVTAWTSDAKLIPLAIAVRSYQQGLDGKASRRINVRWRVCNDGNQVANKSLPLCPKVGCRKGYMIDDASGVCVRARKWESTKDRKDYIRDDVTVNVYLDRGHPEFYPTRGAVVLTSWSAVLGGHIRMSSVSQQVKMCNSTNPHAVCPSECMQRGIEPVVWDHFDRMCKSYQQLDRSSERKWAALCGCVGTCYTPQANNNSAFPWRDEEQRKQFVGLGRRPTQRERRSRWNSRLVDSVGPKFNRSTAFCTPARQRRGQKVEAAPFSVSDALLGGISHHLFFIPEAKLIICGIPKVGMTEWLKFLRFTRGAGDYLSLPHLKADKEEFLLYKLPRAKVAELLVDPAWTKAVFFRSPEERLLSAYLDKIVKYGYSSREFKLNYTLNFTQFVDMVTDPNTNTRDPKGMHFGTNPHWGLQTNMCGLDYLLPMFDFIGNFDHLALHTRMLLERVGMWDTWGKTFDSRHAGGRNSCAAQPPAFEDVPAYGFNQQPPPNQLYQHGTNASGRVYDYYTPELLERVRRVYAADYRVWEELKERAAEDVMSGSDLSHVREACM